LAGAETSAAEIVSRPEPGVGQHTSEILAEAGMSKQQISSLIDGNAVYQS